MYLKHILLVQQRLCRILIGNVDTLLEGHKSIFTEDKLLPYAPLLVHGSLSHRSLVAPSSPFRHQPEFPLPHLGFFCASAWAFPAAVN